MKISQYNNSLSKTVSFLRRNGISKNSSLYHSRGICKKADLRTEGRESISVYREIIEKRDYDILLFNDGFFSFDYFTGFGGINKIRYLYFDSPYDFPTYKEYLKVLGGDYKIYGENFRTEYEQELSEASLKEEQVYLRYDFSADEYSPGMHPISHIHVGFNTEIRLSVSMIITPMVFVMFTLKQVYFDKWKTWIKKKDVSDTYRACKRVCRGVPSDYFSETDKLELYFV